MSSSPLLAPMQADLGVVAGEVGALELVVVAVDERVDRAPPAHPAVLRARARCRTAPRPCRPRSRAGCCGPRRTGRARSRARRPSGCCLIDDGDAGVERQRTSSGSTPGWSRAAAPRRRGARRAITAPVATISSLASDREAGTATVYHPVLRMLRFVCRPAGSTTIRPRGSLRIPRQAAVRALRHPGVRRRARHHGAGGGGGGRPHRLPGGGEGPGAGGRPGQGGRHQARRQLRRGAHPRRGHPRDGHQGPRREGGLDRAGERHRRGVLRLVHPRPGGQAPPRDALRPGWRRDRAGGGGEPRRHRQDPRRPGRRAHRGAVPRVGGGGEAQPRGHRGRGRHPDEAVPRLRRGRRRPGGDQPADPHSRRPGARARRQGHARRQRDLPSPRLHRLRRHPGARRA